MDDTFKNILALVGITGLSYYAYRFIKVTKNQTRDLEMVPETHEGELDQASLPAVQMLSGEVRVVEPPQPRERNIQKIYRDLGCSPDGCIEPGTIQVPPPFKKLAQITGQNNLGIIYN